MGTLILPAQDLWALARPQQQQQQQQQQKKPEGEFAITVDVPLVTVDVVVTDSKGNYVSGLQKQNFRILEDGVPQTVTNFAPTEAPITTVILMEFSKLYYGAFAYYATEWTPVFLGQLKKEDWVALVSYDLKTRIEVDFTQNKFEVQNHIARMYFPGFSEANLFDALLDTLDRLQDVKGKKSILILASGLDTFSKHTLDDVLKKLKQTDVTIFSVGVGTEYVDWLDRNGYLGNLNRIGFLQAQNQLGAFARLTGGRAWFPQFYGQLPGIFSDVASSLRNQYSIGYSPSNQNRDGKFRKIKVQLVGNDGQPLVVPDAKGKPIKFVVYAREGYQVPKGSVSD
jgi:VWFA-related protein